MSELIFNKKNYYKRSMYPINPYIFTKVPIPSDYIVRYDFDGNLNDKSANLKHLTGTVTYVNDRYGNSNQAAYVNSRLYTSANVAIGTNKMSMSFWVKFSSNYAPSSANTVAKLTGSFTPLVVNCPSSSSSAVNCLYWGGSNYSTGTVDPITLINDGKWHHIVVTADKALSGSEQEFYIDGVHISNATHSNDANTAVFTTTILNIGATESSNYIFNGYLDDFRLYDRILNTNEIAALFNE